VTKREVIERLHGSNEVLRHRKVLVVDDDIRDFSPLPRILENHEMRRKVAIKHRASRRRGRRRVIPSGCESHVLRTIDGNRSADAWEESEPEDANGSGNAI